MKRSNFRSFFIPFFSILKVLCRVGLLLVVAGCAVEVEDESGLAEGFEDQYGSTIANSEQSLSRPEVQALSFGKREIVVTGITAAENIMFSTNGRLYISGDDGIFELIRDSANQIISIPRVIGQNCKFGGMAEYMNTLYAVCYDNVHSYLYAAQELPDPSFERIWTMTNIICANGLASDGQGGLYTTTTMQGKILYLKIDELNPMRIESQRDWLSYSGGLLPNGIKIHNGTVYWGDFGIVRKSALFPWSTTLLVYAIGITFFDDFYVDNDGMLIADYLFGSVLAFGPFGQVLGGTPPGTFINPSAVIPAEGRLGFSHRDLLVTEKGSGNVVVFHY